MKRLVAFIFCFSLIHYLNAATPAPAPDRKESKASQALVDFLAQHLGSLDLTVPAVSLDDRCSAVSDKVATFLKNARYFDITPSTLNGFLGTVEKWFQEEHDLDVEAATIELGHFIHLYHFNTNASETLKQAFQAALVDAVQSKPYCIVATLALSIAPLKALKDIKLLQLAQKRLRTAEQTARQAEAAKTENPAAFQMAKAEWKEATLIASFLSVSFYGINSLLIPGIYKENEVTFHD